LTFLAAALGFAGNYIPLLDSESSRLDNGIPY